MTWNPATSALTPNYLSKDADTDLETDAVLCAHDRTKEENYPSGTTIWKHGKTPRLDEFVGFSRLNLLMHNGLVSTGFVYRQ